MPGLDGTGPTGEGRPGRGQGRCGKGKQAQRSDTTQRSWMKRNTDTTVGRGAGSGGSGRGALRRRGRM